MSSPLDALFLAAEFLERTGSSPRQSDTPGLDADPHGVKNEPESYGTGAANTGSNHGSGDGSSPDTLYPHHQQSHPIKMEASRSSSVSPASSYPNAHMASSLPNNFRHSSPALSSPHPHHPSYSPHPHAHHHHHIAAAASGQHPHSPHDTHMMLAAQHGHGIVGAAAGEVPKRSRSHSFSGGLGGKRAIKSRETHNLLEKNRRAQLKTCFDTLRDTVPCLRDGKISTVTILEQASEYIVHLKQSLKAQQDELRELVLAREKYIDTLRQRGIDVQMQTPGRYTQSILDPSFKVEDEVPEIVREPGRLSPDEGEGEESDEVVVDVVEVEEDDDMMGGLEEPPSKRRHSVCVMEDEEDDIDIVGVSSNDMAPASSTLSVPIPIPSAAQNLALAHTPSPPFSLGSATASDDQVESPAYEHDRDVDMVSWQTRNPRQRSMSVSMATR